MFSALRGRPRGLAWHLLDGGKSEFRPARGAARSGGKMATTTVYQNGCILTMDSRASTTSAVAERAGRIVALGAEAEALTGPEVVRVDLAGRTLLPGFIDGHSHFSTAGLMEATQVDLSSPPIGSTKNFADIRERLRQKAAQTPKGGWILGYGYDDTALEEKRHPCAADIDAAAPEHHVLLRHVSGHVSVGNTLALKTSGYTREMPDPPGGIIRRDANGDPNGVLEEPPARERLFAHVPPVASEDWRLALRTAGSLYAAKGVTTAQDGFTDQAIWDALFAAHAAGELQIRVQVLPGVGRMSFNGIPATTSGTALTPDRMLTLGPAKMLADGSLQCYTGYLSNPYHKILPGIPHGPEWRGYPIHTETALNEMVLDLHRKGWQIAIHGNGDDAIQMILNAYELAQKTYPRHDARHFIIHCQTVREDQLDRMARLGVGASFFVVHTWYWGDRHWEIFLGEDRARRIDPLRSALSRRIPFSLHNDTFVTPIDPLLSVWSAVTRKSAGGRTLGAEQAISTLAALRAVTIDAAWLAHEETLKGSIEPGKLADFVILEKNPLAVPAEELRHIGIVATIVGGKTVFGDIHSPD